MTGDRAETGVRPVWIEAALNGPWGRERQPGIPVTVEEIVSDGIAAANSGAAIVHVHAYDPATGRQDDRWETYARIIEGIRAATDAIVYPTIPLAGSTFAGAHAAARYAHTQELARRGLLEWTVCDPGSCNFLRFDEVGDSEPGFIYQNPVSDIREGLRLCREYRLHPGFAIYEPGFTRLGAALAAASPGLPTPIYRFMFSDEFAWGFPPNPVHLGAHLRLLEECHSGAPWMVAGLGVDIRPVIAAAIDRGGHVRVGLEDAPWRTEIGNRAWVEHAAAHIRAAGADPATPAQVRATLEGAN